jgi:hypothetical protein
VINLFCSLGLSVVEQTYIKKEERKKEKRKEYIKQIDKRKQRSPRGINLIITV